MVIFLFAFGPISSMLMAKFISSLVGCTLNEGSASSCELLSIDIGPILYSMNVLGWLSLITFPIGGVLVLIWFTYINYRKSRS